MEKNQKFDILIHSDGNIGKPIVNNIAEMIFKKLPHRSEDCYIIYSHYHEKFVKISLKKLRFIISQLYEEFQKKEIKQGDTVLLTTLSVNNLLLIHIMFIALSSYGVRVLLPMFVETNLLNEWFNSTKCNAVILSKKEILSMKHCEKQKKIINEICNKAEANNLTICDLSEDFSIESYFSTSKSEDFEIHDKSLIHKIMKETHHSTEAVIFTTSGSTGKSKLILYEQGAFINNCMSWQESEMFESDKMGGRSFIDIFPHTISTRAFFNALWTGFPICMIISEWIKQKPEKILPLLIKMKPETLTMGPSSFEMILEFINLVPEIKELAFSDLKKVVSTGAPFDRKIAEKMDRIMGLCLHNAYGTTETQQVLTTVLNNEKNIDQNNISLGKPFLGVSIGLEKFDNETYKLFIKSPFGCKEIIKNGTITHSEFFYTGDIVKMTENNKLIYVGREQTDFFKSGYGMKIPIIQLKKYYQELHENIEYIEFFPFATFNYSLGIAALIIISDDSIPPGRIINRRMKKKYYNIIKKINYSLSKTLEPYEYEQQTISRFILVNSDISRKFKETIPIDILKTQFKNEIRDLLYSNEIKSGISNMVGLKSVYLMYLLNYTLFRNNRLRKFLLEVFLKYKDKKNEKL